MYSRRIALIFLAACGSSDSNSPDAQDDAGIDGPPSVPYRILAAPRMAASSTIRNKVIVVGTQQDGTPAHDDIVMSFDRPGAGTYQRPALTLGNLGATTYFSGCDLATPGCAGPVKLTAALASAPSMPVATLDVELVDPIDVNPAKPCLGGGDVLYLKGNDTIFNGEMTFTGATWTFDQAYNELLDVRVQPMGAADSWSLRFDVRVFGAYHIPDVYEDARISGTFQDTLERDHPAMHIRGFGKQCTSVVGRYEVLDYTVNTSQQSFTIAFEQRCNGAETTVLTGCVHHQ